MAACTIDQQGHLCDNIAYHGRGGGAASSGGGGRSVLAPAGGGKRVPQDGKHDRPYSTPTMIPSLAAAAAATAKRSKAVCLVVAITIVPMISLCLQ